MQFQCRQVAGKHLRNHVHASCRPKKKVQQGFLCHEHQVRGTAWFAADELIELRDAVAFNLPSDLTKTPLVPFDPIEQSRAFIQRLGQPLFRRRRCGEKLRKEPLHVLVTPGRHSFQVITIGESGAGDGYESAARVGKG